MASETVLLYNCGGPEWSRLRQVLMMLRLRMRPVEADQYGLTLQQLLEQQEARIPVEEEFHDPMLVFCGLSSAKLEQLLTAMRRASLPPIPLKAILTPPTGTGPPSSCGRSCAGSTRP